MMYHDMSALSLVGMLGGIMLLLMITVVIHEFGHGIAYVSMTGGRVALYMGSPGMKENSFMLRMGKYDVWIKKNIFVWKGGRCVPYASSATLSQRQLLWFILWGPLANLLTALAAGAIFVLVKPEGAMAGFFVAFCLWSLLVFIYNMIPRELDVRAKSGGLSYTDGYRVQQILKAKKLLPGYVAALSLSRERKYAEAAALLDDIISKGTKDADTYRMAVGVHIELQDYKKGDALQKEQVQKIGNINVHDRINMALLKTLLGNYDEAIAYYKHLLLKDGHNKSNLNNMGYTLTIMGQYSEAIPYLDRALEVDDNFSYAYSNRAYAKMMRGWWADGKADNDRALQLDNENAHAYRNAGLYCYEKGDYKGALQLLEKAASFGKDIKYLDRDIADAHRKINELYT